MNENCQDVIDAIDLLPAQTFVYKGKNHYRITNQSRITHYDYINVTALTLPMALRKFLKKLKE